MAVLLTVAGDQVPVMLLVDVAGKTGAGSPEQIGAIAANVGVTLGLTVTVTTLLFRTQLNLLEGRPVFLVTVATLRYKVVVVKPAGGS